MKKALFSVDNIDNIKEFAIALKKMGWHIIATKESVKELHQCNIVVEDVADFVKVNEQYGFPPTLHAKIEAALTLDIPSRIDLVYDIPYPITKGNDVGGRTLLALGAKGNRIVVFTPEDMKRVIEELSQDTNHKNISENYSKELIVKANIHIAEHYLQLVKNDSNTIYDGIIGKKHLKLLNGENPYQIPADLFDLQKGDDLSLSNFQLESGSAPCYTNLADLDCILHTLCLATEAFHLKYKKSPYITIASKHGNPCGMSINWNLQEKVIIDALFGNPLAVWGGEFITNFKINQDLATLLYKNVKRKQIFGNAYWMLDIIAAPEYDNQAIKILGKRNTRKLLKNRMLLRSKMPNCTWSYREVRGGFLKQPYPNYILDIDTTMNNNMQLEKIVVDSLIIAWSIVYSSNHGGNEIALVKDRKLIGVGGGPSTVEAAETAVRRAKARGHDVSNSIFAADAFFPFTDAPEILKKAGCIAGIVPLGGKNELLVKEYFCKNNINVLYIPSQFRGFCRH